MLHASKLAQTQRSCVSRQASSLQSLTAQVLPGTGRWNLRKRKAVQQHPPEVYSGCTASICGSLGKGEEKPPSALPCVQHADTRAPQVPLPGQLWPLTMLEYI